jgi:hypothetical protein
MVHSNLTFGGLTHLHRTRGHVENQLGSTGARTLPEKEKFVFCSDNVHVQLTRLQHWIGHGAAIIGVREFATWKIGDVGLSGSTHWCGSELTRCHYVAYYCTGGHVFFFCFFGDFSILY